MSKFFANVILISFFVIFSFGSHSLADARSDQWNSLVEFVIKKGEPLDSPFGTYLVIKAMTPNDQSVAHVASYFSLVGGFDSKGPCESAS